MGLTDKIKKVLTTKRLALLTAVNLTVVIVLSVYVAGLQSRASNADGADGGDVPPPPPHEKLRDAQISLNPSLAWEANIGGSGDDEAVAVYRLNGAYHIFGHTRSKDLDFAECGGNSALTYSRVGLNGRTELIKSFGTDADYGEECVAARLTDSGFAVLSTSSKMNGDPVVYLLDNGGAVTKSYGLGTSKHERGLDLFWYGGRLIVVTEVTDTLLKRSEFAVFQITRTGTVTEKRITRTGSLSYVTLLPKGNKYIICANLINSDAEYAVIAEFDFFDPPIYYNINPSNKYAVLDFQPAAGGYAALTVTREDGSPKLLRINNLYGVDFSSPVSAGAARGGKIISTGAGAYIFVNFNADVSLCRFYSPDLSAHIALPEFNSATSLDAFYVYNSAVHTLSATAGGAAFYALSGGTVLASALFGESGARPVAILPEPDGQTAFINAPGGFGETDVWVMKIRG